MLLSRLHHCARTKNCISLKALTATIRHDMTDTNDSNPYWGDTLGNHHEGEMRNSFQNIFLHSLRTGRVHSAYETRTKPYPACRVKFCLVLITQTEHSFNKDTTGMTTSLLLWSKLFKKYCKAEVEWINKKKRNRVRFQKPHFLRGRLRAVGRCQGDVMSTLLSSHSQASLVRQQTSSF